MEGVCQAVSIFSLLFEVLNGFDGVVVELFTKGRMLERENGQGHPFGH